jgi:hypothetical protein
MFEAVFMPQINELLRWSFLNVLIFYTAFEFLKLVVYQLTEANRKFYSFDGLVS